MCMTRCFLAITLPDEIKDELRRIQSEIKFDGKINFPQKENLHLTLKFFGDITDATIEKIKNRFEPFRFHPIKTSLSSVGVFPDLNRIRVIWVSLSPDKEIKELYDRIEEGLSELNFQKEARPFSTHITIGRVKFLKSKQNLIDSMNNIKVKPLNFEIAGFSLISSTLTPKGSEYRTIANFGE